MAGRRCLHNMLLCSRLLRVGNITKQLLGTNRLRLLCFCYTCSSLELVGKSLNVVFFCFSCQWDGRSWHSGLCVSHVRLTRDSHVQALICFSFFVITLNEHNTAHAVAVEDQVKWAQYGTYMWYDFFHNGHCPRFRSQNFWPSNRVN